MATIKKIILLALAAVMMEGCNQKNENETNMGLPLCYRYIIVDSCEYIDGPYVMSHKGNCKFCEQRRQKELEELVIRLKEK